MNSITDTEIRSAASQFLVAGGNWVVTMQTEGNQPRSQAYPIFHSLVCVDKNTHKPKSEEQVG